MTIEWAMLFHGQGYEGRRVSCDKCANTNNNNHLWLATQLQMRLKRARETDGKWLSFNLICHKNNEQQSTIISSLQNSIKTDLVATKIVLWNWFC